MRDHYEIIGLECSASDQEIRDTCFRLGRDFKKRMADGERGAEARFKEVEKIYEILGDSEKRTKYDRSLSQPKLQDVNMDAKQQLSFSKLINDYSQYKALTEKKDWSGICNLNGVDMHSSRFATMKEMNRLPEQLQPGEVVFCFTAGVMSNTSDSNKTDFGISTWLVVLTDRRFLFLDAAMLTSSIDVHSILHKNVQAVRVAQGFVLGKINIDTGGRSTLIDNCEKKTVKVIGDLANEWLQVLEERRSMPSESAAAPVESGLDKIRKLGELKALGLVSEQEFNDAKAKVLASL